LIQSNYS
jgi:hypothetical protein